MTKVPIGSAVKRKPPNTPIRSGSTSSTNIEPVPKPPRSTYNSCPSDPKLLWLNALSIRFTSSSSQSRTFRERFRELSRIFRENHFSEAEVSDPCIFAERRRRDFSPVPSKRRSVVFDPGDRFVMTEDLFGVR